MPTLTQKHNLVMEWLDSVEEAEGGKNQIELRADGLQPGMIITLTHGMPQKEPTTLPTTLPSRAKFDTVTPSSTNPSLIPSTTLVNSPPSPLPASAAPSPPSSVSSEASDDDAVSSVSSEASDGAASSVSEEPEGSTSTPSPLLESPSAASEVLPTRLPASSAILPFLPTTLSTQQRDSDTSLVELPTTASPERPMQEKEALPSPQETATEARTDTAQAVGIAFGSLVGVASLVLAALIIYKCRRKR